MSKAAAPIIKAGPRGFDASYVMDFDINFVELMVLARLLTAKTTGIEDDVEVQNLIANVGYAVSKAADTHQRRYLNGWGTVSLSSTAVFALTFVFRLIIVPEQKDLLWSAYERLRLRYLEQVREEQSRIYNQVFIDNDE